jgi:hypothetical protein
MFNWLKNFFEEKKSNNEVTISFDLSKDKPINTVILIPTPTCSFHPDYVASKLPTNNCNGCWEYFSQKCKR